MDADRAEENEEFEQKVNEHNEATAVISEARRIFTEGMEAPHGESVFLQRGSINPHVTVTSDISALV